MDQAFMEQFDGLLEKYAELLLGDNSPEQVEKIKIWALYSHMHKTMPNLTQHWTASHPEAKATVRALFEEVKQLNEAHRAKAKPKQEP
ncbi:YusU family protein [Paenibacillus terrigena]|uniref:YusU family protein n=1 Tax=Paenibacillus terrigena TaxID=369333 RepID=UPI0003770FC0|nr:YusU family protein [Paenibacillus terrigena]